MAHFCTLKTTSYQALFEAPCSQRTNRTRKHGLASKARRRRPLSGASEQPTARLCSQGAVDVRTAARVRRLPRYCPNRCNSFCRPRDQRGIVGRGRTDDRRNLCAVPLQGVCISRTLQQIWGAVRVGDRCAHAPRQIPRGRVVRLDDLCDRQDVEAQLYGFVPVRKRLFLCRGRAGMMEKPVDLLLRRGRGTLVSAGAPWLFATPSPGTLAAQQGKANATYPFSPRPPLRQSMQPTTIS